MRAEPTGGQRVLLLGLRSVPALDSTISTSGSVAAQLRLASWQGGVFLYTT
jgi:hypothetical protein